MISLMIHLLSSLCAPRLIIHEASPAISLYICIMRPSGAARAAIHCNNYMKLIM